MDQLTAHQCFLTRSFRYGQHIADLATRLLEPLGNTERLFGREDIKGGFVAENPDAYISRTNAKMVATLVQLESRINEVYLIGEGRDILNLLDDVHRLQNNRKAAFGEFFGFKNWNSVLQFCAKVGVNPLTTVVNLVEKIGEPYLRELVTSTCKDPVKAKITLSTAHKAKGLEFDAVSLSDDFPEPMEKDRFIEQNGKEMFQEAVAIPYADKQLFLLKSELQILYVAVTRARRDVTLPLWCYELFRDIVGATPDWVTNVNIDESGQRTAKEMSDSLKEPNVYAVLDFETTGLNPNRGDRAIEIGIVLIRDGKEIDSFSSLINPSIRLDTYITELTGISDRMLASAPSAYEVMPKALEFIKDAQLVAHNASFDKKFWRHELQQTLGIVDERDFVCTLMLSRRIFQSFSSHKLDEIAQELAIEANNSHRALADAQVTAQVLTIMLERLRVAHSEVAIDVQFLHSYQRKTRSNLPDLTTKDQILEAGKTPVTPHVERTKKMARKQGAKVAAGSNEGRAVAMNAEAVRALQVLEQLLDMTLTVDDRLDWDTLGNSEKFCCKLPMRPFIVYDDEGMPTDIEYLSMPTPKPAEPVVPVRPVASSFRPDISVLDKLIFREQRLLRDGEKAYSEAVKKWEAERQQLMANFVGKSNRWMEDAKAIDQKNDRRYQQCIEDQKQWWEEKQFFEKQRVEVQASVDSFKLAYFQHEASAVERYVSDVLSRSTYPDYFPDEATVIYDARTKTIEVRMRLIHPDDLPTTASVSYVKTRDEIKSKPLSSTARNALYGNVVRSVCVRTLHEVVESDTAESVEHVIINGYVDTVDLSTGHDQEAVIASVLTSKSHFLNLRLERIDTTNCFEGLGGRSTSRSLPKLSSVLPFTFRDIDDDVTV